MIPVYLDDLQLPQVFEAYTDMVDRYLLETMVDKHIVDSETNRICGFVTDVFGQNEEIAGEYFSVENPTESSYALLQIDHGIIKSSDLKKCDCAIANNTSLCFIEFKAKAYSSLLSTIEKNYKNAIEQLNATIGLFDSHHASQGTDIRTLRSIEAYICFRQGYPRNTSTQMNYQVAFAAANKGIPLLFARNKKL